MTEGKDKLWRTENLSSISLTTTLVTRRYHKRTPSKIKHVYRHRSTISSIEYIAESSTLTNMNILPLVRSRIYPVVSLHRCQSMKSKWHLRLVRWLWLRLRSWRLRTYQGYSPSICLSKPLALPLPTRYVKEHLHLHTEMYVKLLPSLFAENIERNLLGVLTTCLDNETITDYLSVSAIEPLLRNYGDDFTCNFHILFVSWISKKVSRRM